MTDKRKVKGKLLTVVIGVYSYEWHRPVELMHGVWRDIREYVEKRRDLIDQFSMCPLGFEVTIFDNDGGVSRSRLYSRHDDGKWRWEAGYQSGCSRIWREGL